VSHSGGKKLAMISQLSKSSSEAGERSIDPVCAKMGPKAMLGYLLCG